MSTALYIDRCLYLQRELQLAFENCWQYDRQWDRADLELVFRQFVLNISDISGK